MLNKYYDSISKTNNNLFYTFRILDDLCNPSLSSRTRYYSSTTEARTEAKDDELHLSIDVPGVKTKDLVVQTEGRLVKIKGSLREEEFSHSYNLSKEYDPETISATHEDGVLTLTFKKSEIKKSKSVEIKSK